MAQYKDSIDSMFINLDHTLLNHTQKVETMPVTFWIPKDYKTKFDLLQEKTGKKAGKLLQDIIKKSLDRLDLEAS